MRTISREQIRKRLELENPWWRGKEAFPSLYREWSPRQYINLFYPLITNRAVRRAVVLMGPRRVGKTVMIHHVIQQLLEEGIPPQSIFFVTIDNPIYNGLGMEQLLELYKECTELDYLTEECFVFFDEIQYLKEWEKHLKTVVDTYPSIKCIVSGSAAAALKLKSTESGAGRFTDFLLPPLTFYEYLSMAGKDHFTQEDNPREILLKIEELNQEFIHYLNFGGYPEAIFSQDIQSNPGRFIKSDIIDKVLLRDLPSLYGIQDIQELNTLFTTLAFNTAGEISLEDLSKNSGVSKNTLKKYIEYLESAFLIKTIQRVDKNARRFRRANTFKVYLTNPSMRCALYSPLDGNDSSFGHLVETGIASQQFHSQKTIPYYARWKQGEIDFLTVDNQQKIDGALEIKWSDRSVINPSELKHLRDFCHSNNLDLIWITTRTKLIREKYQNIAFLFVPSSILCLLLGKNIVIGKQKEMDDMLKQF